VGREGEGIRISYHYCENGRTWVGIPFEDICCRRQCENTVVAQHRYSRSNSTKSSASEAGNVREPRLMSQVGRVFM